MERWCLLLALLGATTVQAERALVLDVTSADEVDYRLINELSSRMRNSALETLGARGITVLSMSQMPAEYIACGSDSCRRDGAAFDVRLVVEARLLASGEDALLQLKVFDGAQALADRTVRRPAALDLLDAIGPATTEVLVDALRAKAIPPAEPRVDSARNLIEPAPPAERPAPSVAPEPVDPALGIAAFWGLTAVAGVVGIGGLYMDLVPATARNHTVEPSDAIGLGLYGLAAAIATVAIVVPLPGSVEGKTVGCMQCTGCISSVVTITQRARKQ